MFSSAGAALRQMFDRKFRGVLALGLIGTFALFLVLLFGLQWVVSYAPTFGFAWLEELYRIISALLLTVVFVFMGAPVAQLFASLFLDRVADAVEAKHYPEVRRGQGANFWGLLRAGLLFTAISVLLNLLAIPVQLALVGVGALVVFFINGYLAGRTFFELAALRHQTPQAARSLRRKHRLRLFFGGALISLAAMIPLVNFFVPLFGAAMMTHEYNKLVRT